MSQSHINSKRIAKNSFVLYLRMLFQMFVFLYTSRVVVKMLGIENYGIYDVVASFVVMLSFLNNSLTACSQRFITYALGKRDEQYLQDVYSASIMIHLMMVLLVFLFGETIGLWYVMEVMVYPPEKFWEVMMVYQCSLFSGLLLIISIPYNATIIAYERLNVFALITVADTVMKLLVASALYFITIEWRLVSYGIMLAAVALITRLSYSIYCKRAFPSLHFTFKNNPTIIREMISFSGWSTLGNTSIAMNTQGLNLVLNYFFGPALNAARGLAFQIQMAVSQFIASFQMAINPQITKTYALGDISTTNMLVLRSSRLSFMLILLMVVPLLVEAPVVLQVWLDRVPEHSVSIVRLLLLVSMVDAVANPIMVAAAATGRVKKYHICVGGTLMLTVPFSVLFLYFYPVPEIIFVLLLCITLLAQCVRVYICRGLFSLDIRGFITDVAVKVLLAGVLSAVVPILINHLWNEATLMTLIARVAIYMLWMALVIGTIGLKKDERQFLWNKLVKRV